MNAKDLSLLYVAAEALYERPREYVKVLADLLVGVAVKTPEFIYTVEQLERAFRETSGNFDFALSLLKARGRTRHDDNSCAASAAVHVLRAGRLARQRAIAGGKRGGL